MTNSVVIDLIGTFSRFRWRSREPDSDFAIGILEDKTVIVGEAPDDQLVTGLEYQFQGKWDMHPTWGKQFKFIAFVQRQPHSKEAIITYLLSFAPLGCGVGSVTARRIVDEFGQETLSVVRTDPEAICELCPRISPEQAEQLAEAFGQLVGLEGTKINLMQLFAGRSFPRTLIDEAIAKWGILADSTIKENPFVLLIEHMKGCGFARVDRLYLDLGLDRTAIIRQMFCVWHVVRSDTSGSTWLPAGIVVEKLREAITATAANPKAAIEEGVANGWLRTCQDTEGKRWIADGQRAEQEKTLTTYLLKE